MKNALKHWKTTVAGILYLASALIPLEYRELAKGLAIALLGSAASDGSQTNPLN